jgi:3'-phosphoadenosine 5'-phosphosulfate sulfotransferase (PAPS reductase)/FAD synthetase
LVVTKTVCWFSCGAASAVATKIMLSRRTSQEIVVARCVIPSEHEDNERFAAECEKWFGQPILNLKSDKYTDTWDVWEKRRFIAGPAGAPCTTELKKAVRWQFEADWQPDLQVFGYTAEETERAKRFKDNNPEVKLVTPLIEEGLNKSDCLAIIDRAGIAIPQLYNLGFSNNNCMPCGKASSPAYWNRVRRHFPERFDRMAKLARSLNVRMAKVNEERVFLEDLDPNIGASEKEPDMDCSLMCAIAETKITNQTGEF